MDHQYQHPIVFESLQEVVTNIQDGDTVAIGGLWFVRIPVALVDALVNRGVGNLTVITHASGLALDQLIAAKLVKKVIFSFASMDVFGLSPYLRKAIENKEIEWEEWTALRMIQALEAGRQNLPSFVMHPPIDSDFFGDSEDFRPVSCPITERKIGIMRSLQPDIALVHAQQADEKGNIQFQGSLGIDRLLIGASKQTFVSVEEIVPVHGFTPDPRSYIVPHFLVNRICHVPGGAYPSSCLPYYITDYWKLSSMFKNLKRNVSYKNIQVPDHGELEQRLVHLKRFVEVEVSDLEKKIEKQVIQPVDSSNYTLDELMAVIMAEQVKDNTVTTVGSNTPLSMVAYLLAKKTHAKNNAVIPFCGLNDVSVYPITLSLAEVFAFKESTSHWAIEDLWQWIYQKSLTFAEFGSTAQVDKYGNINNSIIGSSDHIKVRLPGQAGLGDIINLHQNFYIYITRQDKRRLVNRVDFISGTRHFLTAEERKKVHLPIGSAKVFTNLGIFELDQKKRTMVLTHIHPGVTIEEIQKNTDFKLDVSKRLEITRSPSKEQLYLIRNVIDPFGFRKLEFATGEKRKQLIEEILIKEQKALFNQPIINLS